MKCLSSRPIEYFNTRFKFKPESRYPIQASWTKAMDLFLNQRSARTKTLETDLVLPLRRGGSQREVNVICARVIIGIKGAKDHDLTAT